MSQEISNASSCVREFFLAEGRMKTDVAIIGGGPGGTAAAMFLSKLACA